MPFKIIRNDITKLSVDAIVNAANAALQMGGGVCGAIFNAAGSDKLQVACDKLAPIKTGEAVITQGFDLPAKFIIHTAGPVYSDGKHGEEALLRSCYTTSLKLAVKHECESIAFPLISSGIYGYPKAEALRVATAAIRDFIGEHDIDVSLVVFDKEALVVSETLLGAVKSYIDDNYIDETKYRQRELLDVEKSVFSANEMFQASVPMPMMADTAMKEKKAKKPEKTKKEKKEKKTDMSKRASISAPVDVRSLGHVDVRAPVVDYTPMGARLEDMVGNLDEPFSATLMRLIDQTGKKDAEVYRRANIDRRLFSKIRSNANYAPSKPTVLALAVALELNLGQTQDLLGRAGFALSRSRKFDVIVEYFIQSRKYDIFQINEVLFSYDQPLLGG